MLMERRQLADIASETLMLRVYYFAGKRLSLEPRPLKLFTPRIRELWFFGEC
jgi:hypothetical protein